METKTKYEITLSNVNDVKTLVYSATSCRVSGRITGINTEADIQSLLGLFRLDLSIPHVLEVYKTKNADMKRFVESLKSENIKISPVAA